MSQKTLDPPESEQETLLEQYKTYLDTIDHFAEKRLHLHEFFMTVNSFLGTLFGYVVIEGKGTVLLLLPLAFVGFSFSYVWYLLVTNFTTVNRAKWKVIYDMEKKLPYQPFQSEWAGKGKLESIESSPPKGLSWLWTPAGRYYSTSSIDSLLPKLFGTAYIFLALCTGIYWLYPKLNNIVNFLQNIWRLGLGWVGIVILIPVLVIIALWLLNRRR